MSAGPVTAIRERVALLRRMRHRATPGPLVVRGALCFATITALALAAPSGLLLGRAAPVVLCGALLVTLAPRSRIVSFVLVGAAVGWLLSTTVFDDRVLAWRLVALAAAMYVVHTLAALAAVLPYDAVIPPGVLAAWLVRASLIAAISASLGILALIEARRLVGPTYVLASIGAVLITGLLVWVLTRSVRR